MNLDNWHSAVAEKSPNTHIIIVVFENIVTIQYFVMFVHYREIPFMRGSCGPADDLWIDPAVHLTRPFRIDGDNHVSSLDFYNVLRCLKYLFSAKNKKERKFENVL